MSTGDLSGVPKTVSDLQDTRMWKTLDAIDNRLISIEKHIQQVIRLEERVNGSDQVISRLCVRMETHDSRMHDSELWQARQGESSHYDRELRKLSDRVNSLNGVQSIDKGQKDITSQIAKTLATLFVGWILFQLGVSKSEKHVEFHNPNPIYREESKVP